MTYSVYQFFADDTHEHVLDSASAVDAVNRATSLALSVGGQIGTTRRVIITDADDCTVFEWRHGEGVVFPPQSEAIP